MAASETATNPAPRWRRIAGVLLAAVLLAEGFGQAYFRIWSGHWLRSTSLYVWSPYGLVRNNPALTSPQYGITANGFRDTRAYDRARRPGALRVLLVGGSVLYSGIAETFLESERRVDSGNTVAQFLEKALAADHDFSGMTVEVLNAGVNFNRIVEVATAYTGEYVWWNPDVVVVFGSANNFFTAPGVDEMRQGTYGLRGPHPWAQDFERLANVSSLAAWLEQGVRLAADRSAAVTIASKATSKVLDFVSGRISLLAARETVGSAGVAPALTAADDDSYFRDYAAVADGLVATAKAQRQDVVFFWEYFLGDVRELKPLSADEQWLAAAVRQPAEQTAFHARMRERWMAFMQQRGLPHVDPLTRLSHERDTVFIDYLHYTRRGNAVMADELYKVLKPVLASRLATAALAESRAGDRPEN